MAERRMFARTIIESDAFLALPMTSQALYMHLCMECDDDGFLNAPKRTARAVGASDADLDALIEAKFILVFDSGVICIKHWKVNNYIQKDRYKSTVYQEEYDKLNVKENGVYSLDTEWIQNGYTLDTQYSIGKDSIGKVIDNSSSKVTDIVEVTDYFRKRGRTEEEAKRFFDKFSAVGWKLADGKPIRCWQSFADDFIGKIKNDGDGNAGASYSVEAAIAEAENGELKVRKRHK